VESERWKVKILSVSFARVFGIIEFLFIKINQNCLFAGDESDDNVKDHEGIVIDRLV